LRISDFHFDLPEELIAQHPAERRDQSRLLVLYRSCGEVYHKSFTDFPSFIEPGDLIVLNNSKVIPARLRGSKPETGGQIEMLLVEEVRANDWWTMLKPGKRTRAGTSITIHDLAGAPTDIEAELIEKNQEGHCRLRFRCQGDILDHLDRLGETPLPPYIQRSDKPSTEDRDRYQTVYAGPPGSAAAPTAGLHFTDDILDQLKQRGAKIAEVTLHVGLGTFAPVKVENVEDHQMHFERYEVTEETADLIRQTKTSGKRVIAIGTTTVRVLETIALQPELKPSRGKTNIFITPPYDFKIVDALLTNFHLPESTLLMLVSALASPNGDAGRETMLNTYRTAVENQYRFFSYGDAMLIV
jgi:S-adenosylmethionine:tRNA ribosyltransferase-isomerase